MAVDDAGDIYATGSNQNKIWKLDPTGKLLKKWGGTGKGNYLYNGLREVALDSGGNIYVADGGNHRIVKFDSSETFVKAWGTQGGSIGQFNWPDGLAFDASNYLYVTDQSNSRVQVFKADGSFFKTWGTGGSGNGQLNIPSGISFDAEGYVYVTDTNNHRIEKFTADGTFITKWGTYGSGDANFSGPADVIVDPNLNVYVADRNNGRIVVFRSTWKPSIVITSPLDMATVTGTPKIQGTASSEVGINKVEVFIDGTKLGDAALSAPVMSGLSVTAAANASNFTYDWNTAPYTDGPHKIKIKATNGLLQTNEVEITVIVNNSGDTPPTVSITSPATGDFVRLSATIKASATDDHPPLAKVEFFVDGIKIGEDTVSPYEYALDSTGLIDGDHVIKVTATDSIGQTTSATVTVTVANHEEFAFLKKWSTDGPHGLAFDKAGNLYVGGRGRVRKFSPEGTLLLQIDNTENYTLDEETFVALDSADNIYATCPNQNYIVKFDKTGKYLKKWGAGGSNNNQFSYPVGIAIDSLDNLYIADQNNHRIVKYDTNGTFIRKWGAQGNNDGWFQIPRGLAVDPANNVYVADSNNQRIQVFDSNGTYLKRFGTGSGSGDTNLNAPQGVGLDAEGNVYIADHNNNRIVKYDPNGNFLAKWGSQGTGDVNFQRPIDVKVDSSFYVYVSDRDNSRIIKFRSSWKPAIELTAPLPNASVSGTTQILANVSSDVGISKVEVYVAGVKLGEASASQVAANVITNNFVMAAAAGYTFNWNTTTYADAPYELKIVATNLQGKTSEVKITVVVNNSNDAAPTVSITSPAAGDYVRLSATIKATASDNVGGGIAKVEFYADGIKLGQDTTVPYEYVWNASSAVDGEHEIKAMAYDTIGQTTTAGLKIQVANHEGFAFLKKWTTENPCALAIDKSGNIIVGGGNRVRKYSPDGTLLLQIDATSEYGFEWDMGVAVDSQGNIYATCPGSNYVAKFDAAGKFLKKWGTLGTGNTQFDWPIGIAADSSDNIYVVDNRNQRIVKFDSSGTFIKTWGNQGGADGSFQWPWGISVDASNNVYVADQSNSRIQVFNTSGTFIKKIGGTWGSLDNQFRNPRGVGFDSEGNVYVADTDNHRVVKYDSNSSYLTKWGTQGSLDTNFNSPFDVKVDSSFYVYVADRNNNRILRFRSSWKPQIEFVAPAANAAVSGTTAIQANVASDIGINKVEVYVNNNLLGNMSAAAAAANVISGDFIIAAASSFTYNWNTTTGAYPDGAYKLKLIAYNAQNKTSEVEITVIVNNSSDAVPTVSITIPAEGDIIRLSATIKAAAADDKGIAKVEFYADGTKIGEDATPPYEYTWDAKTVVDGEHEIKVTAYDTIGQTKSATVKVTTQSHEEFGFIKKWTTDSPNSLAFDRIGNLYVGGGNRVRKYSPEGVLLLQVENSSDFTLDNDTSAAVDGSGNIYATSPNQNYVVKLDSTGKFVKKWGAQGTGDNQFDYPSGIAVDGANNVYVVDHRNHRVMKFDANGTFLAKWGSQGGGDGSFQWPWAITVDSANNIYVADQNNQRIQKFTSSGTYIMKFGSGWGSGDTNLREPRGVGLDTEGNVYIADTNNHRIVKYDPTGIFLAKWGTQGSGDLNLQWPCDVKVDALFNVYVADRNNGRIIKFRSTWRPGITLTSPLANAT
ncbi:MAG: Ig-like domain-containing protein [Candidatus Aminicenantes bacterium]|nr:Ig-like domain-containing protein [Candidatus Aminicenantes bacterium]